MGLGIGADDVRDRAALRNQVLTEEDEKRLADLGANGRRDPGDLQMTHCVTNERIVVDSPMM